MIKKAYHIARNYLRTKAVVLMYHRIAEPASDVWEIAVSPQNFEAQLNTLRNQYTIVPVNELIKGLKERSLKRNSIAITFDDGCLDNFKVAKPILESFDLPATFFIPSGYTEGQKAFWWEVLENIFLLEPTLPTSLTLTINGVQSVFEFGSEAQLSQDVKEKHRNWKAMQAPPPTRRAACYYEVWKQLKVLPAQSIDAIILEITKWAAYTPADKDGYCMRQNIVAELDASPLFDIGCHTVTHAALAHHEKRVQEAEIKEDKLKLESMLSRNVNLLAYPYGNYNAVTREIVSRLDFDAAFSTEETFIHYGSDIYSLPRYQVKNDAAGTFNKNLKQWFA